MDQAASLRKAFDNGIPREGGAVKAARVLAVSSGKGGVGKTNSVVNLAAAFAAMQKRFLYSTLIWASATSTSSSVFRRSTT